MKNEPKKTVSLNGELAELCDALDAALMITGALQNEGLSTQDETRRAPGAIRAVVSLVSCRLKNLGQLVRGTLDAEGFCARHNAGPTRVFLGEEPDVLIPTRRRRSK